MKFALTALSALLFVGGVAHADSLRTSQLEILPKVKVDGKETTFTGRLHLDFVKKEISVEVLDDKCHTLTAKMGEVTCMALPENIASIVVPLESARTDGCGTSEYAGKIDQVKVDGPRAEVEIEDNTRRSCENIIPFSIGVKASVLKPMTDKTTTFEMSRKFSRASIK